MGLRSFFRKIDPTNVHNYARIDPTTPDGLRNLGAILLAPVTGGASLFFASKGSKTTTSTSS
jgi:hypothetical protein